jgi:hypothetical protein
LNLFNFKNREVEAMHHDLIIAVADQPEPVPCVIDPEPYTANWSSYKNADADQAFDLCVDCPLMVQCGNFARANQEEYGVWGGELPRNRVPEN